jgi:hypothetical protein
MLFNGVYGMTKIRVCLSQFNAVQDETHGRHIQTLQVFYRGQKLRTRGNAGFGDNDGAIDKASQILRLGGDEQRRGIGKNQASLPGFGLRGHLLQQGSRAAASLGGGLVRGVAQVTCARSRGRSS